MTRFTRVKSTHQRVEGASTPWKELKDTPEKDNTKRHKNWQNNIKNDRAKPKKAGDGTGTPIKNKPNNNSNFANKDKKFNGNRNQNKLKKPTTRNPRLEYRRRDEQESANFTPVGNPNVRGSGQSKSVKIFGSTWVGEEDARRLQGMAKKLKKEGISRKDILDALKGERRNAEKASKRRRDKTCYNCRQFGHVLADCPGQKTGDGEGMDTDQVVGRPDGDICFKCGSTEHTSRYCKRKNDKFEFAKCFVCSKSGHIARQCPTNTKGIYPAGGSCDECGSVTHLKRDCPELLGESGVNDPDAQVARVSDPFLSTEYEQVPDSPKANPDLGMEVDMDTSEDTQPLKPKVKKSKKGGKRKTEAEVQNNEMETQITETVIEPLKTKPTLPAPPAKKRRVVKF